MMTVQGHAATAWPSLVFHISKQSSIQNFMMPPCLHVKGYCSGQRLCHT